MNQVYDVIVIGAGQAGLATGYHLRRTNLSYVILDAEHAPGAAWRHGWDSLRLFSPGRWSSLPGWIMPSGAEYPSRNAVIDYLAAYEARYQLPVQRPVWVAAIRPDVDGLIVESDQGRYHAHAVVSATGTWHKPFVPHYPGQELFRGRQIHSANYHAPGDMAGQRVLIVGGGNSAAQILSEVAPIADATWVTVEPPRFLPDEVDGHYLFEQATLRYHAQQQGRPLPPSVSLGDIVMVPPVRAARDLGMLQSARPFTRFTATSVVWADGAERTIDVVIWCTGFQPALAHLAPLGIVDEGGRVVLKGTRSVSEPRLWLVGYGEWTGFASATLIGVGRSARSTVAQITDMLGSV